MLKDSKLKDRIKAILVFVITSAIDFAVVFVAGMILLPPGLPEAERIPRGLLYILIWLLTLLISTFVASLAIYDDKDGENNG